MAAKRIPRDNISQWKHQNLYTKAIKGYKIYILVSNSKSHITAHVQKSDRK